MFGKSKILRPNEKVLIAYSGGANSRALVHFCFMAIHEEQHKKMTFSPMICHIDERSLWKDVNEFSDVNIIQVINFFFFLPKV
jgi:PP-loop superfamily ATP-utilizing enzyme